MVERSFAPGAPKLLEAVDVSHADEPTTALDVMMQAQVREAPKAARCTTYAATIPITRDLGPGGGQGSACHFHHEVAQELEEVEREVGAELTGTES